MKKGQKASEEKSEMCPLFRILGYIISPLWGLILRLGIGPRAEALGYLMLPL